MGVGVAYRSERFMVMWLPSLFLTLLPHAAAPQSTAIAISTPTHLATSRLPLTPTRKVRFRTTEGTWMSLDVSPDGQTIVFDLLGNIYTLPISGGRARPITSGMAINGQPRYSPDGRHLVFVSDRGGTENVWIMDREGQRPRQLTNLHGYQASAAVASPVWSPDGRTIVVSQRLGATRPTGISRTLGERWLLAAYDVQRGQMQWVSDTASGRARSALGAAFAPDGRAIYAAVDGSFRQEPSRDLENWRIARIELATGRIQPEMPDNIGRGGMRPVVSRDGRYLLYASSSGSRVGLRLRDRQTDREQWLVREVLDSPPPPYAVKSSDLAPGYAFTPDSKAIVAAYGGKIRRIDLATGRISVIPFEAQVERELGPLTVHQFTLSDMATLTRSAMQASLSPDGNWVAFSALDRIWVMELPHDGQPARPPRRLTDDYVGEFYPSWSPNGRWIAYSTWVDGEGGTVRRAYAPLTSEWPPARPQQVSSEPALYFHTAVAPDGERIVAVRAALPPERLLSDNAALGSSYALSPTLVWLPSRGGQSRTITSLNDVQSLHRYPVDQVYFTDDPDRVYVGFTSWRWDGTDRRTAPVVLTPELLPASDKRGAGVLSANRRRALFARSHTVFELAFPNSLTDSTETLDLERARTQPLGTAGGAARRWGTAPQAWMSWSRDGRRALFSQGGTLFVGDVRSEGWTSFVPLKVPLLVPADMPQGTIVLRGARLITMRGWEVIERGDLVVRDNRIVAVGPLGQVAIPKGARILDLSGKTILPGYVDVHDHLWLPRGVHPQQCWQCTVRLAYGVTASRDPQPTLDIDVFAYGERERTGDLLGPRVFSTGIPYLGADPPIQTIDDARDAVRPYAEDFLSETFKVYYDHSTDRRVRQLLAMALAERRLNATVHVNGVELALTAALDGFSGIEHAPRIAIYDDLATLIAQSGAIYTHTYGVTPSGAFYYMFRRHKERWGAARMHRFIPHSVREATHDWLDWITGDTFHGPPELDDLLSVVNGAARIVARGGQVAIGSHGNIPGLGYHYEMWLHALGGMPNHDILRSATIVGATAIGHRNSFGTLACGNVADLQVLDENPLEDIHHTTSIRYVMKNGRLFLAEDLTEIWPRNKPPAPVHLRHAALRDSAVLRRSSNATSETQVTSALIHFGAVVSKAKNPGTQAVEIHSSMKGGTKGCSDW